MVEGARLEIVWAGDRLGGSNPLASATFLTERIKKRDSDLALLGANPLASATRKQAIKNALKGYFCKMSTRKKQRE